MLTTQRNLSVCFDSLKISVPSTANDFFRMKLD